MRTPPRRLQSRRGYVLLAVLWLSLGIVGLAAAISVTTRNALATSRNRIATTEAIWNARACFAYARAAVEGALRPRVGASDAIATEWHRLDIVLGAAALPPEFNCRLAAYPMGTHLDLNTADSAVVVRLLRGRGVGAALADSAASALLDGRPFSSLDELRAARRLASIARLDTLVALGTGPVALNHAHEEVLAALPGMTPEAVARVMEARAQGRPLRDFGQLARALSPVAREIYEAAMPALVSMVVLEPVGWSVTARSIAGRPPLTAVVEAQFGQLGGQVGISRRRMWTQ